MKTANTFIFDSLIRNHFREFWGFCDSSKRAFGCVIYGNTKYNKSKLITSTSRLIPSKSPKIPRAELTGAILLDKSMKEILKSLKQKRAKNEVYLCCDSQIVLSWIKNEKYIVSKAIN
jgi:Pao retrotransposon peptidase